MKNIFELKPCPFCGGLAQFRIVQIDGEEYGEVYCVKCGARSGQYEKFSNGEVSAEWNKRDGITVK